MPQAVPDPQPSLLPFFETINAYQRSAALKAAIDLGLFTAIGEGKQTAFDAAAACGASERGVRILCDSLVVAGFLTKQAGRYALTPDTARFLDRRSPAYVGGAVEFLLSPDLVDAFRELPAAVREGGTAMPHGGTVAPEHPVWVRFARGMAPMQAGAAELLARLIAQESQGTTAAGPSDRPMKVLDVSAGHGLFGIALARHNPRARVVALDWANVLEVAKENAAAAGVADRFEALPGSAFDVDYGNGYDLVLLPNFLHHFDPTECERLLGKARAALADGGRAVIVEFIPDDSRVTPPVAASFALTMLATTPAGDAYTFRELEAMCRAAGFARSELRELPPTVQRVVMAYK